MIEVMPRREPELLSWKEAKKGFGNGWRLPTIDEMQSIYKSKLVYQLCSPKFEDIYLTSTPTINNRMVRVFSTINGNSGCLPKNHLFRVWAVRDVKEKTA